MDKLPDHFALDFGNHSVKAVHLRDIEKTNPKLIAFGSQSTPFGAVNSEDTLHQERLAEVVKNLVKSAGIKVKQAVVALPESVVSTRVSTYKGLKPNELQKAVYWDAKQSLPIPVEEMELDYMVLAENAKEKEYLVLRVAVTKKIVNIYRKILEKAGVECVAIETEGIALARMLKKTNNVTDAVVLDFGSQTTDMSIIKEGNLVFSQSISTGSDVLTRAIMNEFSLEYKQSEEYKRKYGIVKTELEGKIAAALEPVMKVIVDEVLRGIEFYKSQTGFSAPSIIMLAGDGALLPGLVPYLTEKMSGSVSLVDPWKNIVVSAKDAKLLEKGKSAYAVVVGLALRVYD